VLVTGASSGIGRAVARQLLDGGAIVAGAARRRHRLEAVTGLIPVVADLSDPEAARGCIERSIAGLQGLDALIHCAGVTLAGAHQTHEDEVVEQMYRLHVLGTDALVRAALPKLIASERHARVAMITSAAALVPAAYNAAYASSKAFQLSLAESLHHELAHRNVTVTAVLCGIVNTELVKDGRGFPPALLKVSPHLGIAPETAAKRILQDVAMGKQHSWPAAGFMRIPGAPSALGWLTRLTPLLY